MPKSKYVAPGGIFIPTLKDEGSWKVIITTTNGTEYDVTNYIERLNLTVVATTGISNLFRKLSS